MILTQQDYQKIKQYLQQTAKRDTDFPLANLPVTGGELLPIIQDDKNVLVELNEFYEEFAQYIDKSERVDFFNVSRYVQRMMHLDESAQLTLEAAIEACPPDVRRAGQTITFLDGANHWATWQYQCNVNDYWTNILQYWRNIEISPNLGIEAEVSPLSIDYNTKTQARFPYIITLSFNTLNKDKAEKITYSINDFEGTTIENEGQFTVSLNILPKHLADGELKIHIEATQYGITYSKTLEVQVNTEYWLKGGSSTDSILRQSSNLTTKYLKEFVTVNIEKDGDYMCLIVPDFVEFGTVTLNGYLVPFQLLSDYKAGNITFKVYKSMNAYTKGVYGISINGAEESRDSVIARLNDRIEQLTQELTSVISEFQEYQNQTNSAFTLANTNWTRAIGNYTNSKTIPTRVTSLEDQMDNLEETLGESLSSQINTLNSNITSLGKKVIDSVTVDYEKSIGVARTGYRWQDQRREITIKLKDESTFSFWALVPVEIEAPLYTVKIVKSNSAVSNPKDAKDGNGITVINLSGYSPTYTVKDGNITYDILDSLYLYIIIDKKYQLVINNGLDDLDNGSYFAVSEDGNYRIYTGENLKYTRRIAEIAKLELK